MTQKPTMKRCPECRRDYHDDTLSFCLADGTELVYGLADEEPATAVFGVPTSGGGLHDDEATRTLKTETIGMWVPEDGFPNARRTFDKRMLLAPLLLAVIVLGSFLGYRYLA